MIASALCCIAQKEKLSIIEVYKIRSEWSYENNNIECIIWDAYLDSFVTDKEYFRITYDTGTLYFNSKKLAYRYDSIYVSRIKKILNGLHIPVDKQKFVISNSIPEKNKSKVVFDLQDQSSEAAETTMCQFKLDHISIVTRYRESDYNPYTFVLSQGDSVLLTNLCSDQLVSKNNSKVKIRCNSIQCWINDSSLTAPLSSKYLLLLSNTLNRQPTKENDFISATYQKQHLQKIMSCYH